MAQRGMRIEDWSMTIGQPWGPGVYGRDRDCVSYESLRSSGRLVALPDMFDPRTHFSGNRVYQAHGTVGTSIFWVGLWLS